MLLRLKPLEAGFLPRRAGPPRKCRGARCGSGRAPFPVPPPPPWGARTSSEPRATCGWAGPRTVAGPGPGLGVSLFRPSRCPGPGPPEPGPTAGQRDLRARLWWLGPGSGPGPPLGLGHALGECDCCCCGICTERGSKFSAGVGSARCRWYIRCVFLCRVLEYTLAERPEMMWHLSSHSGLWENSGIQVS